MKTTEDMMLRAMQGMIHDAETLGMFVKGPKRD
jgi:hypothetical protein